jgi:hypothetical protein
LPDEADIGSGEKNPGQKDTEKMIEQVGDKARRPEQNDQNQREPNQTGKTPDTGQAEGE